LVFNKENKPANLLQLFLCILSFISGLKEGPTWFSIRKTNLQTYYNYSYIEFYIRFKGKAYMVFKKENIPSNLLFLIMTFSDKNQ
jgi:hypothetical protein